MLLTAAPASLRPVYASNEKETLKREYIRVEELSMYSSPDIESTYVEHKPSPLEENISLLRHSLTPCTNWCQDSYCKIKPKVETAVEHSKGSKLKKVMYPLGFTGIAASLYFPQQAAIIAKATGSTLYDYGLQGYIAVESLWKDGGKKKKSAKKTAERSEVNSSKPADTSGLESVGVPEKEFIPSTAN
ncbi:MICOS complex subunit MIC26 isoform X2 [Ambystoma mexicanum]|uniref:MICOS complex subunit MIC26 isoform X2 n=1 Tax=Ambystoma mexicanum TaxID=8296 RepID=UPI0037E905ED